MPLRPIAWHREQQSGQILGASSYPGPALTNSDLNNPVELHAPQAYFNKPLQFASGPGFASDWLTAWTDAKGKVWFDIEAVTPGDYEIELSFACPLAVAGSRVRISVSGVSMETSIPAAPAAEIPLPHRDEAGKAKYRNQKWAMLKVVTFKLAKGPSKLTLEPLSMPGTQVMDLKQVKLLLQKAKILTFYHGQRAGAAGRAVCR